MTSAVPPQFGRADLEAFWMPFTANRQFKANPRLLARAEGMHYWTPDGRQILDGTAGLWCVQRGPRPQREIAEAVAPQLRRWTSRRRSRWATRPRSSSPTRLVAPRPRARPRLLHELRLGVGRYRAQDRARLSPGARRRHAHALHRPRARLSRRRLRRHLGRRHGQQPQVVRHAAAGRRSPAAHARSRSAMRSRAASRRTASSSPMNSSAWSRCTTPRRSRRSSSNRSPVPTGVLLPPEGLPQAPARDLRRSTASC